MQFPIKLKVKNYIVKFLMKLNRNYKFQSHWNLQFLLFKKKILFL